jgi:hypothetical protein
MPASGQISNTIETMTIDTHAFVPALLLAAGLTAAARQGAPPPLAPWVVPAGFKVGVFAENPAS